MLTRNVRGVPIKDADLVDDRTVRLWLRDRGFHKRLVQVEDCQGSVQIVDKTERGRVQCGASG
jgi:hypothetical protein